jgi:hypothetical protein
MNWDLKHKGKGKDSVQLDKKLLGKGEYETMLEKTNKKKVNLKATVGTY